MKRKVVSILLVASMAVGLFAGCGSSGSSGEGSTDAAGTEAQATSDSSDDVLEFYHGYYQDESEWAAAQVMRDIYDEFAAEHADGPVTFKPIAVENRDDIVSAQVAGGNFPDMVDMGSTIPQSAISQGLVMDLKPFIDENNLQDAVGLNYTQGDVDGAIYTIHDQIETRGLWYNSSVLEQAGVSVDDLSTWDGFAEAMEKVRSLGGDTYGYAAGQGSLKMINAYLAQTEEGRALIENDFTEDTINSETFAEAFKTIAALDQANGSDHTTADVGNLMADFNENGMAAVLSNGVWNASGISEDLEDVIQPMLFPGNVSIASAGSGLTVSSGMSEEKTELALEFIEYMVSPEVQAKIFTEVQANPCNTTLDLNQLAEESGDPIVIKLAEACSQANSAGTIVKDMQYVWGGDVANAIINALMECATSGTDIDARFEQLQSELIALIG
jgi:raffinose/stachyose/melibiose transport system substrate-binding protein